MKVCIIGAGSIGRTIARALEQFDEVERFYVFDKSKSKVESLVQDCAKAKATDDIEDVLGEVGLVIEAASQRAVEAFIPKVLENGKNVLVMSVGAFVDEDFRHRCKELAKARGAHIFVPSGAVCGIEGICAAAEEDIEEVVLISYKNPNALASVEYLRKRGIDLSKVTKPTVIFDGTASDAVRHFPKNINVAATISLAGVGFERTRVKIVVDPKATKNMHRIVVKGRFGEIEVWCRNEPFPENPRTSYLAALSAVSAVRKITGNIWIGV
ncbi:MAG: aspartate dehydrogenase [Euryarchaeota archaeon]|nr:aspartate dehydrogenase [Euryarchaeota archaeon]